MTHGLQRLSHGLIEQRDVVVRVGVAGMNAYGGHVVNESGGTVAALVVEIT